MITKEKIVEKALELFNNEGIEYVRMRELALALNMRIGNVTYYFPTKNDLVMEITQGLRRLNTQVIGMACHDLKDFFTMYRQIFHNQYKYKCLFLSFVHLVSQNHLIAAHYKETEKRRKDSLRGHISAFIKNGYLVKTASGETTELIISHFSLISRFWLSESRISYDGQEIEVTIGHYLELMGEVLLPYVTAKGRREIAALKKQNIQI
ncbi:MAG TPA: TetR/AcrR family transcriptional regulator [Mucilaginibacter sp.]